SLLLSHEKKQEKMRQATDTALAIAKYKYAKLGPEGEFYRKNLEFTKPIIDKINKLIAKIGEDEGYDFIFDASSGALLHAMPKYDITDQILEELNKGSAATKGKK
ncbi:MAG: OmpH family outer membrane protein, partial [Calditrichales bacterium]|nr:OmpH family outer membrane protein [Calditrichales bacterium]